MCVEVVTPNVLLLKQIMMKNLVGLRTLLRLFIIFSSSQLPIVKLLPGLSGMMGPIGYL